MQNAESIFASYIARVEAGETVDFDALCKEHAGNAEKLRELKASYEMLGPILRANLGGSVAKSIREVHGSEVDPNVELEEDKPVSQEDLSSEVLRRLSDHAGGYGRYKIRGEVARGGQGAVLRVWDEDLRRNLAMKVILGSGEAATGDTPNVDPKTLGRFLEEAHVTGQLDHPGIVPVHELGLDSEGQVYFTMKLVKGETFKDMIEKVHKGEDGWTMTRALGVLLKVCEAVAYAHAKGVIHRDLKPANIMVGRYGEVYVMDWGLSRILGREDNKDLRIRPEPTATSLLHSDRRPLTDQSPDSPLVTMDGDVVGTPAYMSPEQAAGRVAEVGPQTDVYAVGAMLYQVLAGHMPYVAPGACVNNYAIWQRVQEGPPPAVEVFAPKATPELVAICQGSMARDMDQRYPDMRSLADDLRAFLEGRVVRAYRTGAVVELRKWIGRNRPLAATLAMAIVLLVAGLGTSLVFKWRSDQNALLATENALLATENARLAERNAAVSAQNAEAARWQTYVSCVLAAGAALRANEPESLRNALDAAPVELRGWEWRYLDAQSDSSLVVVQHEKAVNAAAFTPDGSRFVTCSDDKTARVWDSETGEELLVVAHGEPVRDASFDTSGKRLLTVSRGEARITDADSGMELLRIPASGPEIWSARWNARGTRVFVGQWIDKEYGESLTTLIDTTTGHVIGSDPGYCKPSPDGSRFLTTDDASDQASRLWETETGTLLFDLGKDFATSATSFSPDGTLIASFSQGAVVVFDALTGVERFSWKAGWTRPIFSSDSASLAIGFRDRVEVIDLASGEGVASLAGDRLEPLCFSRESSRLLAKCKGGAMVWEIYESRSAVHLPAGEISSAEFVQSGTRVLARSNDYHAQLWDWATGRLLLTPLHSRMNGTVMDSQAERLLTFSRDGSVRAWDTNHWFAPLPIGYGTHVRTENNDRSTYLVGEDLEVWGMCNEMPKGSRVGALRGSGNTGAAASADGKRLHAVVELTAYLSKGEWGWRARNGSDWYAFSSDGGRVALASQMLVDPDYDWVTTYLVKGFDALSLRTIQEQWLDVEQAPGSGAGIWELSSGKKVVDFPTPCDSVEFSPDGLSVAVGARDGTLRVFDARTGDELSLLRGHTESVVACAFGTSGRRLITASRDQSARLWDVSTGTLVQVLPHDANLLDAIFSDDETRVVTLAEDGALRLFDTQSGTELLVVRDTFQERSAPYAELSWSPDGSCLLVSNRETIVLDSVSYRRRVAELQEKKLRVEGGLPLVKELAASSATFDELVLAIQGRPDSAALEVALRDFAIELAHDASLWLDELFREFLFEEEVLARILADEEHPAVTRDLASQFAADSWEYWPLHCDEFAWRIVVSPSRSDEEYARALRATTLAVSAWPDDWGIVNTHGVAQFRNGHYEEALTTLLRSIELSEEAPGSENLAFIAMSQYQLGRVEEARASLEQLRGDVRPDSASAESQAFLRETESMMGGEPDAD